MKKRGGWGGRLRRWERRVKGLLLGKGIRSQRRGLIFGASKERSRIKKGNFDFTEKQERHNQLGKDHAS